MTKLETTAVNHRYWAYTAGAIVLISLAYGACTASGAFLPSPEKYATTSAQKTARASFAESLPHTDSRSSVRPAITAQVYGTVQEQRK
jgi:hypothetical protein